VISDERGIRKQVRLRSRRDRDSGGDRPWDQLLVAAVSVGIYYWGGRTGLDRPLIDEDEVEEEEVAEAVTAR
jgi:hypothetical protein